MLHEVKLQGSHSRAKRASHVRQPGSGLGLGRSQPALPPMTAASRRRKRSSPTPPGRSLGRSLWFDPKAKQVVLRARVVLREGYLEHLMCSKGTKEHEAILATDAVPHQIHAGLLLTGAEPGHPVRFVPKFEPPTGSAIAIELHWRQDGKTTQVGRTPVGQGRESEGPPGDRLGFRRQPALRRPRHQEAGLRRRRGRPDHRRQFRQCDPRPADRELRQRRRPRVRHEHREDPPARHRGLRHAWSPSGQGEREARYRRGATPMSGGFRHRAWPEQAISPFEARTIPQPGEIAHREAVFPYFAIRPASRRGAWHDIR